MIKTTINMWSYASTAWSYILTCYAEDRQIDIHAHVFLPHINILLYVDPNWFGNNMDVMMDSSCKIIPEVNAVYSVVAHYKLKRIVVSETSIVLIIIRYFVTTRIYDKDALAVAKKLVTWGKDKCRRLDVFR